MDDPSDLLNSYLNSFQDNKQNQLKRESDHQEFNEIFNENKEKAYKANEHSKEDQSYLEKNELDERNERNEQNNIQITETQNKENEEMIIETLTSNLSINDQSNKTEENQTNQRKEKTQNSSDIELTKESQKNQKTENNDNNSDSELTEEINEEDIPLATKSRIELNHLVRFDIQFHEEKDLKACIENEEREHEKTPSSSQKKCSKPTEDLTKPKLVSETENNEVSGMELFYYLRKIRKESFL